jgi:carboxypeptidase Taq
MHAAYEELLYRSRENAVLLSCVEMLSWDELTHMPPGGAENRGEQMALLCGIHHRRSVDRRLGELLSELEAASESFDEAMRANVRELRRRYDRANLLPRSLVEEQARVVTVAQREWELAKENDDFARAAPWLEKIVKLKRAEGNCLLVAGKHASAYDALLDDYEPGATSDRLRSLFDELRAGLTPLLARVVGSPQWCPTNVLRREYPIDRQRVFVESVAGALGFDFHRGRLDPTAHPFFSAIGPGDCRITTRYRQNEFGEAFFATMHEVGHALYEQGLDPLHYGSPLGEAASLGIHESQSRIWEMCVGRGLPFWRHFYPLAKQVFHEALHGVSLETFHRAVNHVEVSGNRVRADALTYNLHVMLRFDLERALIAGDLPPAELPAAWREKEREYLGFVSPRDAEGCLQDNHWAGGMFGYFPGYTLGNLIAAQLFAAAERELGGLEATFAEGDFSFLLSWLRDKIHRHGQRYSASDLIQKATGEAFNHSDFLSMLRRRIDDMEKR